MRDQCTPCTPALKTCRKCGTPKPLTEFNRDRARRDGLFPNCRDCQRAQKRTWYEANAEKASADFARWYAANRAQQVQRAKDYHRTHRDQRKASARIRARAWYRANSQRAKEAVTAWRKAHPDTVRMMRQRRRARHHDAPGRATLAQIRARVAFYGGLCWMCRTAHWAEIDHVIPLTAGGSNWPANLRPACRSCNARKLDKWPFRREDLEAT